MNDLLDSLSGTLTTPEPTQSGNSLAGTTTPDPNEGSPAPKKAKKERKEGEKRTVSTSRLERLIEAKKVTLTGFFSDLITFVEGKETEGTPFATLGEALTAYAEANARKTSAKPRSESVSAIDKLQRKMIQFLFDAKIVAFGELQDVKKSRKAEGLYNAEFTQRNGATDKIWVDFSDAEYVSWGIQNTTLNSISKDDLQAKMDAAA